MALSQVQCLNDNHVNWPMQESKPEFFYSEDQRLALEALVHGGRKAFHDYIQEHSVRQFLSELEQNQLTEVAEPYQPESEGEGAEDSEDEAGSLQYWPERSDYSIPELDIGWPERISYRGVTRVSVYTQPPMEGQTHIKEIVRKTITLAQKVIAVVMDLFTDVDIFKDLLDASFRRRVAVYIILEATGVPHFLSMCERAAMHRGHLKNLRVRSAGGTVLHTRSLRKVCGLLSQKFMFVDGDRALSGSYSYTWMASRLDRNLITVLTGQTVETFDEQFRQLYSQSEGVSLSEIRLEAEPERHPAPQVAASPVPSPATAQKLINPMYALVCTNIKGSVNSTGPQDAVGGSAESSSTRATGRPGPAVKVLRRPREAAEGAPIHPGLRGLEQANLIHYLPTWPEPDPPSDVIGFINIRDSSKPPQAHLTRSELFETSQPVRFKTPLILPEEPVPETACPRPQHKNLRTAMGTTDASGVQKETKEVSSISVMSEEYYENLETTNRPITTDAPEVEKEREEVSTTSVTLEEHYEKLTTANDPSATDTQEVPKEVPSISIMLEEHNENLRTLNHPSTPDTPKEQKETKEVSSISMTSEEHHENLRTANHRSTTDTPREQKETKDVSSIPVTLEEHYENPPTANDPGPTDTPEVEKEPEDIPNIYVRSEDDQENLITANGLSTAEDQGVEKEATDVSRISVTLVEHYKNTDRASPGSVCNGSVQSDVHSQADEVNAARASEPMVKQQLQKQPHPQQAAARGLPTCSQRKQEKRPTHRQVQTDGRKVIQTTDIHYQQGGEVRGLAKTAGRRLDGCIHPPNLAGAIRGGHSLWHGKQLTQSRLGRGGNHPSHDQPPRNQPSSTRSSLSRQLAETGLGIQTSRGPYRQPQRQPQAQQGRARLPHQAPAAQRPPGPRRDGPAPPGLPFTRHGQFRAVNGTAPEAQPGSLQKKALLGKEPINGGH
ncbi:protein FAM83G-like [Conger conger]|uniref:protein FAM83G-like n=1 Tax=Conger conger TaxID=82655 RepID=UPI002A5A5680|nr:protein FAM83G-like [Conger conger]